MPKIEYLTADIKDIGLIQPLWIQLNDHMRTKAKTFRSPFEQMTFDDKKGIFQKGRGCRIPAP
jgi:hypothetical protein